MGEYGMNYENMSDYQINVEVAKVAFYSFESIRESISGGAAIYVDNGVSELYDFDCGEFDYCNNPSDAWVIVAEYDITVRGGGIAFIDRDYLDVPAYIIRDKNPLRAAMICFLKMKDAEYE